MQRLHRFLNSHVLKLTDANGRIVQRPQQRWIVELVRLIRREGQPLHHFIIIIEHLLDLI